MYRGLVLKLRTIKMGGGIDSDHIIDLKVIFADILLFNLVLKLDQVNP